MRTTRSSWLRLVWLLGYYVILPKAPLSMVVEDVL
jgi:hypothetical protein